MKLDRSVHIQIELETRILDLISSAKCFGQSSQQMNEAFHSLFTRYPKDLPQTVRAYARGYYSALWKNLYRNDLIHGYEWDGNLYSKWDEMPEELKERCRGSSWEELRNISGHYWKTFADKGIYKKF